MRRISWCVAFSQDARLGDIVSIGRSGRPRLGEMRPDRSGHDHGRALRPRRPCRHRRSGLSARKISRSLPKKAGAGAPSMRSAARSTAARRPRRALEVGLNHPPAALQRQRVDFRASHRRTRHRHLHADLLRPAPWHLRGLRRREVDAAGDAGARRRLRTRSSSP